MGETRVDLLHLLEDLRDAYPGAAEETILTEIVANSLDSRATTIAITTDPAARTVVIADDGVGMQRRELARYHDIAATTKVRGAGIGFAGVGVKLALLVCDQVVTETRRGRHHVASAWHLASRHRAPWRWVPAAGLVGEHGTAVQIRPANALSPLLDAGFVEATLLRHFAPLLDPAFDEILSLHYPGGRRLVVNGRVLDRRPWGGVETAPISVRLARKRKPAAAGYMFRDRAPLSEERRGIAISTFGKIIRRGWDWLGIAPGTPDYVGGLIEAPALAECLTLNKADFIRSGARGATYLAYRKVLQEAVSRQLAVWGDTHEASERARRRAARPVERDLEVVLMDLAGQFPLLSALVERRPGQRRLPIGGPGAGARAASLFAMGSPAGEEPAAHRETTAAVAEPRPTGEVWAPEPPAPAETRLEAAGGVPRRAGYGLSIQFESRPHDPELGRLVESTAWINEAHPAYRRAIASRSEGYHVALATAMALAPLAVEPAGEHAFVTAFLAAWGRAIDRGKSRSRR